MTTTDTRDRFMSYVSRKAQWGDMRAHAFGVFSTELQARLLALPRVHLTGGAHLDHPALAAHHGDEVIAVVKGDAYYVNPEGAAYARYGFRIVGFPAPVEETPAREALEKARQDALAMLTDLRAFVDRRPGDFDRLDWGHVGSLHYVCERLREACAHVNLAPRTCPVCGHAFTTLSGGVRGCAVHGIR